MATSKVKGHLRSTIGGTRKVRVKPHIRTSPSKLALEQGDFTTGWKGGIYYRADESGRKARTGEIVDKSGNPTGRKEITHSHLFASDIHARAARRRDAGERKVRKRVS